MRWFAVLAFVCGCESSAPAPAKHTPPPPPTERECEQLLAHLVDLEFAAAPQVGADKDRAAAKASIVQAKHDEFVATCRPMTRERLACAMAAATVADIAACDRMQPPN